MQPRSPGKKIQLEPISAEKRKSKIPKKIVKKSAKPEMEKENPITPIKEKKSIPPTKPEYKKPSGIKGKTQSRSKKSRIKTPPKPERRKSTPKLAQPKPEKPKNPKKPEKQAHPRPKLEEEGEDKQPPIEAPPKKRKTCKKSSQKDKHEKDLEEEEKEGVEDKADDIINIEEVIPLPDSPKWEAAHRNIEFPFICVNHPSLSRNIIIPQYEARQMTLKTLQHRLMTANFKQRTFISFREPRFPLDLSITENRDIFPIFFRQEESYNVFVKNLSGKCLRFEGSRGVTVGELKEKIEEVDLIPKDEQRLIFNDNLEDERTLGYYKIKENSIVHLVLKLRGGGTTPFVDISNPAGKKEGIIVSTGPDYRGIKHGLNLGGKCTNSSCSANGEMVVYQVGMRIFDLMLNNDEVKCPICKKWIQALICVFFKCEYKYIGIKQDSATSLFIKVSAPAWMRTSQTNPEVYDPAQSGVVQWKNLKILTRKFTNRILDLQYCQICNFQVKGAGKKCRHYTHQACFDHLPQEMKPKGRCLVCGPLI